MEAILSNSTRKLLWFEITKMLIVVLKINLLWLFIILSGTLSFLIVRLASEISSSDVAVLQAEDKCLGLVIELI